MISYTLGYDDKYKCPCCEKFFTDVDALIKNSWKCPFCAEYIHISAPELNDGCVLIRKPASELKLYDSVHVSGEFIYDVIAITSQGKNKIRVALKEFRVLTYDSTDFVSVLIGGYYEYDWKENTSEPCQE